MSDPHVDWSGGGATSRSRSARGMPSRPTFTGMGAVLLIFFVTIAGATLDVFISTRLSVGAMVALTLGSILAAVLVRRSDLLTVVVAPPLVYLLVLTLSVLLRNITFSTTGIVAWLSEGFPAMALATGSALLICGTRLLLGGR